jgi:hypothetical protein
MFTNEPSWSESFSLVVLNAPDFGVGSQNVVPAVDVWCHTPFPVTVLEYLDVKFKH